MHPLLKSGSAVSSSRCYNKGDISVYQRLFVGTCFPSTQVKHQARVSGSHGVDLLSREAAELSPAGVAILAFPPTEKTSQGPTSVPVFGFVTFLKN